MSYKPILQKTSPCEAMLVVDLVKDKSYESWECKEALMVSTVIQGLINREAKTKIYFIHYPNEHFFDPFPSDEEQLLTEGFFPVPYTYAKLSEDKKYPALSYLLNAYKDVIKGAILIPSLSDTVCDGAIMAGVTACGQLDAVPLTDAMAAYLKEEGFSFEVMDDMRKLEDNISAFLYAKAQYFNEKTTRVFLGQHSFTAFGGGVEDQFPIVYDYFVAFKAFVFCLNGNVEEERQHLSQILNEANYALATPVIGLPVDEGAGLRTIEQLGYYFVIANVQNFTCTSAFESDPSKLHPQPAPRVVPVEESSAYIAFYVSDGDSMGFSTLFHHEDMKTHPYAGEVPIGWSVNPLLMDIFPSLMTYKWQYAPNQYEWIMDWNDQTQDGILRKSNDAAWAQYCEQIKGYKEAMGFYTTNYFEGDEDFIKRVNPFYQIKSYWGTYGSETDMQMAGDTVTSKITGRTQLKDVALIVSDIEVALKRFKEDEPAFLLVGVGDGRAAYGGGEVTVKVKEVMNRLTQNAKSRSISFMMPKDLAATYKAYIQKEKNHE